MIPKTSLVVDGSGLRSLSTKGLVPRSKSVLLWFLSSSFHLDNSFTAPPFRQPQHSDDAT